MSRRSVAVLAFALLTTQSVYAQDARIGTTGPTYSLQNFRPAVDSKGYVTVNASQILGHLDFSFGLVGSYAYKVFNLASNGNEFNVNHFLTTQLQGAIGFFGGPRWHKRTKGVGLQLGFNLPVHIMFGDRTPPFRYMPDANYNKDLTFTGQFVGDFGLNLKLRLLNTSVYPVGLAIVFATYFQSGKADQFLGEGQTTLRPEIVLDKEFGRSRRFRMALNVGALIRPAKRSFTDQGFALTLPMTGPNPPPFGGAAFCQPAPMSMVPLNVGDPSCGTQVTRALGTQITYSLGASVAVVPQRFDLVGEIFGYADVTGSTGGHPLEILLAAKAYMARNSFFEIGASAGMLPPKIVDGVSNMTGLPLVRVFLGFVFEPSIGDRDGDGIKDDIDQCPDDPEDHDGFEDEDGCPDPDNDKDGILDRDDKCPNDPETKNGFQDEDGCPDSLDTDRDKDGIPDRLDKCPDDPEDFDKFEDEDGCPDPDNDRDGILDKDDLCPNDPEDKDGFEDKDGCPEADNDKDRILDKDDKCPNPCKPGQTPAKDKCGPESYNGYEDEDGCPDDNPRLKLRRGQIEILEKIYFETAKAVILPRSFGILNEVAATINGNPQIMLVEVAGHADERGDDDYNMRLTEDRSQAVKTYLLEHGVPAEKLQARGYGETQPALHNGKPCLQHNETCWEKNRRVEFRILRSSSPTGPE